MGFTIPTEIQSKAIPLLGNTNKDFVGQAQTGTGKTAAFGIPLLEKIDTSKNHVQALVLAPTRELAVQVETELAKLSKYSEVGSTCVYGGASYEKQLRALKKDRPQIVVGTPGRVIDLIKRKALVLDKASYCVLDEADEMLNMGFLEDVQFILNIFKAERQLIMFSATMPKAILKLIGKSFNDYELVKVEKKSLSNDDIEQKYFIVKEKHFSEALGRIIDSTPDVYALIFCRTRMETKVVCENLRDRGYAVEILNGDMGQKEREYAMNSFKKKKVKLMVCTDVAARGIDVNNLTHVFNYGLPQDNESYVHRIGRTGRAGLKGKAFTFVSPKGAFVMKKIERHINKTIEKSNLPSVKELKTMALEREMSEADQIIDLIQDKGAEFKTDDAFNTFEDKLKSLNKEELMKLLFSWKFNKTLRTFDRLFEIECEADNSGVANKGRGGGRKKRNGFRSRSRSNGGDSDSKRGSRRGNSGGGRSRGERGEGRSGEGRSSEGRSGEGRSGGRKSSEGRSDKRSYGEGRSSDRKPRERGTGERKSGERKSDERKSERGDRGKPGSAPRGRKSEERGSSNSRGRSGASSKNSKFSKDSSAKRAPKK